jgi:hypothetical protein
MVLLALLLFLSNMLLLAFLMLLAFLLLTAFLLLLSDYRTMAIGLSFFSAIELSEYRISYWQIQETIGLSDIGSRPQIYRTFGYRTKKNYRLPTSANHTSARNPGTLLSFNTLWWVCGGYAHPPSFTLYLSPPRE